MLIILTFAAILAVVGCLFYVINKLIDRDFDKKAYVALVTVPALLMLYGWLGLNFEFSTGDKTLAKIVKNGIVLDQNMLSCENGRECLNYYGRIIDRRASSSVSPITDNPKVRSIKYTLVYLTNDYAKLLAGVIGSDCFNKATDNGTWVITWKATEQCIDELVQYHLYELDNSQSKQLAGFYNPLSGEQRTAFLSLMKEYLTPRFAPLGLEVTGVEWSVN